MKITELKLSNIHRTDRELCYKKQGKTWLLYDDTQAPRQQIATISGSDLDGWTWDSETPKLSVYWRNDSKLSRWRAALVDAALAYINHSK